MPMLNNLGNLGCFSAVFPLILGLFWGSLVTRARNFSIGTNYCIALNSCNRFSAGRTVCAIAACYAIYEKRKNYNVLFVYVHEA